MTRKTGGKYEIHAVKTTKGAVSRKWAWRGCFPRLVRHGLSEEVNARRSRISDENTSNN